MLWNRLGAAYANCGRSQEAKEAYTKALSIKPRCVRALYNLSVGCVQEQAYTSAVSHLLEALSIREQENKDIEDSFGGVGVQKRQEGDGLWDLLRVVSVGYLQRAETSEAIERKDLAFMKRFVY